MGKPKDCTVGERPNRSGTHFATSEGGLATACGTPSPTFFDITGEFILPSDRKAYNHYIKRMNSEKV